ncbi:MAG: MgtC/SapB family protein [Polaromonas sp.]|uniref:MgtC/SapB family protein n=1 Tax=Polaromonas sp. TaxID=1869339 RepID=UPI002737122E|nr:MgtC/SapB family protein [Polaromonas sp.]MDP3797873.1 MgtC/SapB family protein [Polaromonas sp.]
MELLPPSVISIVSALAAALAAGAVVGLERGWQERERVEGGRVAGLRTFSLFGLLGGVLGVLSETLGPWPVAMGLAGLAILGAVSYHENVRIHGSLGATTAVAALLTYALGALAGTGHPAIAVGTAVVIAVLLDLKPTLHRWLRLVEHSELSAALQLLVLSAVILPLLPDAGYGPYAALNPYRLWWAVVLIAGMSLCGHIAMRFTGPQRGIFWTGLLGGLASSTAATLMLARRARSEPALTDAAAAGTLAACGMMFLRITVIVFTLQPALGRPLGVPMVAAGATLLGLAAWQRKRDTSGAVASEGDPIAPFGLSTALGFGAFLGLMAVLTQASKAWLGDPGLYALATLSGLADVDAIIISVMKMQAADGLAVTTTMVAVGLATAANMVAKACIAAVIGGMPLGRPVAAGYGLSIAAGSAAAALMMLG